MSNTIQTQVRDVDETVREVLQLKDLVQQYTTLKQEEGNLIYTVVLKISTSAAPEVSVPIEKMVFIDCNDELIKRLRKLPCGYVTIKEAEFIMKYGDAKIIVTMHAHGEEEKIDIGLSPLYLIDLLYLHVLNEKTDLLSMLKEALTQELKSETQWVETLKEILTMVEIVLKQ